MRIRPSSAGQWFYCPAAPLIQSDIIDDNDATQEGTLVHDVAHKLYLDESLPSDDDELINRAKIYVNYIKSLKHTMWGIEEKLKIPAIHSSCQGTVDFWCYDIIKNLLTVVDYKDGFLEVSPVENKQLLCYYKGLLDKIPRGAENSMTVDFIIVQPRAYTATDAIRKWSCAATDLRGYINQLHGAAHAVFKDPVEKTGSHCRYCRGAFKCEALGRDVAALAHIVAYCPVSHQNHLPTELAVLHHAEKLIKYRLAAVESKAVELLKNGESIPGYVLGTTRGSTIWIDDLEGLKQLAELMGVSITKEKLLTPKQIALPDEMVRPYTQYKPGKTVLQVANTKKAKEIFA